MYITRDRTNYANCKIGVQVGAFASSCDVANCNLCYGVSESCKICASNYGLYYNTTNYRYTCKACLDTNCDMCYQYDQYGSNYSGQCYLCKAGYSVDETGSTYTCVVSSIPNCAAIYYNYCF